MGLGFFITHAYKKMNTKKQFLLPENGMSKCITPEICFGRDDREIYTFWWIFYLAEKNLGIFGNKKSSSNLKGNKYTKNSDS